MRTAWTYVGDMGALVEGGYFKGAAGARRVLLENERDLFAFQALHLCPRVFSRLQIG